MSKQKKETKYYAYFVADCPHGVTEDWKKCEGIVSGTPGARYKAFPSRAEAEEWLAAGAIYMAKPKPTLEKGIYFDAGTGRGVGVEVSVTDETGKNLLHKTVSENELNKFGKYLLEDPSATNNYGELLALKYAIEIAKSEDIKKIFGDSKLAIDFWSQWHIKRKELPEATVALADEVSAMRKEFEEQGGSVERISGDHNPADLGFH